MNTICSWDKNGVTLGEPTAILLVHILFGGAAIVAGFAALLSRKGSLLHRTAGRLFIFSMIVMALAGSYIAYQKPEMITLLAGLFTVYLVVSALLTVRSASALSSWCGLLLAVCSLGIGIAGIYHGYLANLSADKLYDGFPIGPYLFFGGLAIFSSVFDLKIILEKGIEKKQKIRRHAWRMSLALLIATSSFFDGPGAKAFPEVLQGSIILLAPQLIVFGLLVYWLIAISFRGYTLRQNKPN